MALILILRHPGQRKNNFWRSHPPTPGIRKLLPSRGGSTGATPFYPPPASHAPLSYFEGCLIPASHPTMISMSVSSQLSLHSLPHVSAFDSATNCTVPPISTSLPYANHRILQRYSPILPISQSFPIRAPCAPPYQIPHYLPRPPA